MRNALNVFASITIIVALNLSAFAICSHQWSDWEVTYEPTCGDTGEQCRYCTECGEEETKEIPATGKHDWSDWYINEKATCTDYGDKTRWCFECGIEQTVEIPPNNNHNWTNWTVTSKSTCVKEGSKKRSCKICGKKQTVKIAKKSKNGKHKWSSWKVSVNSTYYKTGKKYRTCTICKQKQTAVVPKKVLSATQKKKVAPAINFYKYAHSYNSKKMKSQFAKPSKCKIADSGSYIGNYSKKYNKKQLKYKLVSASFKKNSASVKLAVTFPNHYGVFYDAFEDLYNYCLRNPNKKDSVYEKYLQRRINYYERKCTPETSTKNIVFNLKKTKKGWKISKATSSMINSVNCNSRLAENDFFDDNYL